MIQMISLVVVSAFCFAPLQDETKDNTPETKVLLRKVFVPERDIQQVIKGKFLPIKMEEFNELIENAIRGSQEIEFKSVHLDLAWDTNLGLRGKCYFQLQEELAGRQISFASNLVFSNLSCADSEFHFGVLGTTLDQKKVISAVSGTRFECNVVLPTTLAQGSVELLIPKAQSQSCTIEVANEVRLICNSGAEGLNITEQGAQAENRLYSVRPENDQFSMIFVPTNKKFMATSRDSVEFLENHVQWRSIVESSFESMASGHFEFAFDRNFRCESVTQNGIEVRFRLIRVDDNYRYIRLQNVKKLKSPVSLALLLKRKITADSPFDFKPIKMAGDSTVYSHLRFESSPFWQGVVFEPENFVSESLAQGNGHQFVQTDKQARVRVSLEPKTELPRTDRVEIDFQNGHLVVRQLMKNTGPFGTLRLNEFWEVLSAIDIQQDELPIEFSESDADVGRILLLENENPDVWIVARRKLDSVSTYALRDCLPIALIERATQIRLEPGFLTTFANSCDSVIGIKSPRDVGANEKFNFEQLESLTFKLAADNQRFQAPFEADVRITAGSDQIKLDYSVRWNPQSSSRIIFELNENQIEYFAFSSEGYGTLRPLNADEKNRLSLFGSRTYWAVEFTGQDDAEIVVLKFRLTKAIGKDGFGVELPVSIDNHKSKGVVEIKNRSQQRFAMPIEKLVESGKTTADGYRVFQYSGESNFQFARPRESLAEPAKLEYHVLACRFDVKNNHESTQTIQFVYRSDRSVEQRQDTPCLVHIDSQEVENITAQVENRIVQGKKVAEGWILELPRSRNSSIAVLRIAYRKPNSWPIRTLSIPDVSIEGTLVNEHHDFDFSDSFRSIKIGEIVSSNLNDNVESLLWLPTLAFDTQTLNQIRTLRPMARGGDSGNRGYQTILIQKEFYTTTTLGLAMIFLAIAIRLRRNRFVLYSCIVSLFLAFLLADPFCLISAVAFWGFALGLVIRELARLCRFSGGVAMGSSVLLFLILCVGDSRDILAQSKSGTAKSDEENAKTVVPVVIPLNTKDEPLDIAYLPAKFYERLKNQKPVFDNLICKKSSVEISSQSTSAVLNGSYTADVFVSESGKVRLPFFVQGAIYDSDAVTIDSRSVSFQPLQEDQLFEIEFERQGEQTLQIDFHVAIQTRRTNRIRVPFAGNVSIVNRSGDDYLIRSNQVDSTSTALKDQLVQPNDTLQTLVKGEIDLSRMESKSMPISIVEFIDLSKMPVRRVVKVIPDKPFDRAVRLTLPSNSGLLNPPNEWTVNDSDVVADVSGDNGLPITFSDRGLGRFGRTDVELLTSSSHVIDDYVLMFQTSQESEIISVVGALTLEQSIENAISQWNSFGSVLSRDQVGSVYSLDEETASTFWLVPKSGEISCFAENHYFVTKDEVMIRSEWDLSSESFIRSFEVEIPEGLNVTSITSGGNEIPFVRIGTKEICVFSNLDQAGRFLFEMSGSFQQTRSQLKLEEPRVKAMVSTSKRFLWSNRERRVDTGMATLDPSKQPENNFIFVGENKNPDEAIVLGNLIQFEKTRLEETVGFVLSKSRHEVEVDLPPYSLGDWIGVDLPFGAKLTDGIQIDGKSIQGIVVEKSVTLRKHQVWIPLTDNSFSSIKLIYEMPLENNQVSFASIINSKANERVLSLPLRFNGDELDWQMGSGEIVSRTQDVAIFRDDKSRVGSIAQFNVKKQNDKTLRVFSQEVVFDPDTKRLNCRFFLDPGNQSNCKLELPSGHFLESIEICGIKRNWTSENSQITVPLVSNRYLQVLDIKTIPTVNLKQEEFSIEFPQIKWEGSHPTYFQCAARFSPINVQKSDSKSIDEVRLEFLEQSISLFEINDESSPGWQSIIFSLVQSIKVGSKESADLKQRLILLLDPKVAEDQTQNEFGSLTLETDFDAYQVDHSIVELKWNSRESEWGPKIRVFSAIIVLGILVTFTGRLPRWMRAPGFSLVMASLIWVFGVTWVSLTPESIFAWCWILFAFLFAVLVAIDSILKLRFHRQETLSTDPQSVSEVASTQLADSKSGSYSDSIAE